MIASTLFVRVVPQDKDRGYMLLAGFDSAVVQRTAAQYTTLSDPTRVSLDAAIKAMQTRFSAADVKDCTAPGIVKKLAKLFGETGQPVNKAIEAEVATLNAAYDQSFTAPQLTALSDKQFYEKMKSMVK
jgi:hypothetical protein